MKNGKKYTAPEFRVTDFDEQEIYMDVISTSGGNDTTFQTDPNKGDGWSDPWLVG